MALSDEQLRDIDGRAYDESRRAGEHSEELRNLAALRAVERAVREDVIAELSAGVDVGALADATARRLCQNDRNGGGCPLATETGCSACHVWGELIADALRTAVAAERARTGAEGGAVSDTTETVCICGHGRHDHMIGNEWVGPECMVYDCPCSCFEEPK